MHMCIVSMLNRIILNTTSKKSILNLQTFNKKIIYNIMRVVQFFLSQQVLTALHYRRQDRSKFRPYKVSSDVHIGWIHRDHCWRKKYK